MADSSHVDSNITTTATDGAGNIIVSVSQSNITESNSVESSITTGGRGEKGDTGDTGPAGVVQSIVAGNNIDIDNTDPTNPVVSVETLTLSDVSDVTASATELNYTDGVTSAIQTQIDGKSSTAHTHVLAAGATDVTSSAAELNILDGATLSTTELNYVDGVTSAIQTQLDGKVDENSSITGATKTKITYDAKGLVTAGADATTADIADSTNKRYVTDAQLTVIGNTSGTNTGDQDLSNYVTLNGTQTLTNKTINLTSNTLTGTTAQFNTALSDGDFVTIPSTTDLSSWLTTFSATINSSQSYAEPAAGDVTNFLKGLRCEIQGTSSGTLLTALGFTVTTGYDSVSNRPYTLIVNETGTSRSWGAYLIDRSQAPSVILEAPHPVYDANSESIALQAWQKIPGAILLIAGAERTCPSGTNLADVAHQTGSLFHKVAIEFAQQGVPQIQIHGYADATDASYDVIISQGDSNVGTLHKDIARQYESTGLRVARGWDGTATVLLGTTNSQGDAALAYGSVFVHIEHNNTLRSSSSLRTAAAKSIAAVDVDHAILNLANAVTGQYPSAVGSANTAGTSEYSARADHVHKLTSNTPANNDTVMRVSGAWQSQTPTQAKTILSLENVDNTSDATKNAATATLTNKTLTNPRVNTIYDTNGNKSLQLNATASAVNYLYVVNGATGNSISFRANGTDTNISIGMFSKGSGQVQIRSDTNGFILAGDSVASGVNYVGLTNAATGTGPTITSTGSDTNVDLNITAKGTGNLNIPTGTGLSQFNTSDKTTNYERVRHYWSSNVYTISSDVGGTGTVRPIRIISGNATFGINESTQSLVFTRTTPSTVLTLFDLTTAGTGLSGTSSSQYGMRINPTINQSSTAGYTMLLINPTESATGSGAKLLADFQVGGTSKVSIKNDGVIFPVQAATASAPTYVKGGVYFDTTLNKLRVGGASGWETITSI